MNYFKLGKTDLQKEFDKVSVEYQGFVDMKLNLDMSRGKPSTEQLDLSLGLLDVKDYKDRNGFDTRNYGQLDGVPEAKELFGSILGASASETFVAGSSSLQMMFHVVEMGLNNGFSDSPTPWRKDEKIKFICPVPGYDRHFRITEFLGFELLSVPMLPTGPDMDIVEEMVKDKSVKGIWGVPVHSNPCGFIYSNETVQRLSTMKTAAPDFRIFWDNAYVVHAFESDFDNSGMLNILDECKKAGNENRPLMFCSASKITFAGSGVCAFSASQANIKRFSEYIFNTTICYDRINQIRHVKFLEQQGGVGTHMKKHAALIKPKFDIVLDILNIKLNYFSNLARWTVPKGGYFISFYAPEGTAKRVVELCKQAGVVLTGAGAAYPYGIDPKDTHIRIAPTLPPVGELDLAAKLLCVSTKFATLEKLLSN